MKNKRGFANPYIIGGIILLVIVGLSVGWFSSSKNCDEKLSQEKNISAQLREQLSKAQLDLDNANQIIKNQGEQIGNLTTELNNCKNSEPIISYEKFNLFWLTNVAITPFLGTIINISLGISLFSLFKIVVRFGKKKKK